MTGLLKSHEVSYTHHFPYVFLEREKWAKSSTLGHLLPKSSVQQLQGNENWRISSPIRSCFCGTTSGHTPFWSLWGTEVCWRDSGCSLKDAGWHGSRAQFPSEWCSASESSEQRVTELKHQEISRFTKKSSQMVPAAIHTSPSNCGVFHLLPGFFTWKTLEVSTFNDYLRFLIMIRNFGESGSSCDHISLGDGGLSWLKDCTWLSWFYWYCINLYAAVWHRLAFFAGIMKIADAGNPYWPSGMSWNGKPFFRQNMGGIHTIFLCLCSFWGGTSDASWITACDDVFFIIEAMKGGPGAYEKFPRFRFEQRHGCLGRVGLRFIITGQILKWSQTAWLRTVPFQLQAGRCSRPQSRNCANDVGLLNSTKDSWCCFGEVSDWGIIY